MAKSHDPCVIAFTPFEADSLSVFKIETLRMCKGKHVTNTAHFCGEKLVQCRREFCDVEPGPKASISSLTSESVAACIHYCILMM
jgi:hypothetical protein